LPSRIAARRPNASAAIAPALERADPGQLLQFFYRARKDACMPANDPARG
jgi:hypothetical protein